MVLDGDCLLVLGNNGDARIAWAVNFVIAELPELYDRCCIAVS
jgi:hypothetical protein